jgi:hypothetical protein
VLAAIAVTPSIVVHSASGQIAGMGNVILDPKLVFGGGLRLRPRFAPDWHSRLSLRAIYGHAETGTGITGNGVQEIRGKFNSLYDFYDHDDVLRVGAGLNLQWAYPLHGRVPALDPPTYAYAAEENEIVQREKLAGINLAIDFSYQHLHSRLQQILFLTGNRIAPNLLAYQPLIELDWSNRMYLIGTCTRPTLAIDLGIRFWFARKGHGTALFNTHDGLGGTKREFYIRYGFSYFPRPWLRLFLDSYGYNNLNRGNSSSVPQGFRDGFAGGFRLRF